jgi:hypothetical protein
MSVIKAYDAGQLQEIESFIATNGRSRIKPSRTSNWLGTGVYFWENDPERAEIWQAQQRKGAILECEIDTSDLFNLLQKENTTDDFYFEAQKHSKTLKSQNNPNTQQFNLDNDVFNQIQTSAFGKTKYGIRMAFYMGNSVTLDGNLFPNQHIQLCIWNTDIIMNPRKYIPGRLEL